MLFLTVSWIESESESPITHKLKRQINKIQGVSRWSNGIHNLYISFEMCTHFIFYDCVFLNVQLWKSWQYVSCWPVNIFPMTDLYSSRYIGDSLQGIKKTTRILLRKHLYVILTRYVRNILCMSKIRNLAAVTNL